MRGCDYRVGARYCDERPAPCVDEVTGEAFCLAHAGPLAWDAHDVDVYSLALRLHGEAGTPCPLPVA